MPQRYTPYHHSDGAFFVGHSGGLGGSLISMRQAAKCAPRSQTRARKKAEAPKATKKK
jgi:hypothetical protein